MSTQCLGRQAAKSGVCFLSIAAKPEVTLKSIAQVGLGGFRSLTCTLAHELLLDKAQALLYHFHLQAAQHATTLVWSTATMWAQWPPQVCPERQRAKISCLLRNRQQKPLCSLCTHESSTDPPYIPSKFCTKLLSLYWNSYRHKVVDDMWSIAASDFFNLQVEIGVFKVALPPRTHLYKEAYPAEKVWTHKLSRKTALSAVPLTPIEIFVIVSTACFLC